MTDKELMERYPFLIPRNRWTDEIVPIGEYGEGTELEAMPDGWLKAFGEQMCEDIYQCLLKANYVNDFRVLQIKEKFGELRFYHNGVPSEIYEELADIIDRYCVKSFQTCIICGVPADGYTMGWISPYCNEHANGKKLYPFETTEKSI